MYDNVDDENSSRTHSSHSISSVSLSSRSDEDRYDSYGSPRKTSGATGIAAGPRPTDVVVGQEDSPSAPTAAPIVVTPKVRKLVYLCS